MAYRTGVALHHAARDGAVSCDEVVRNARQTMMAVDGVATCVGASGAGLEAAYSVTASPTRHGVEGVKASTTKTASGMKATATVETTTAATVETAAAATVETAAPAAVETAAPAAVETAAPAAAMARLGYVCEREPRQCAHHDPSKRQNLFAPSSQHLFLHLN
jgi:ribonuclease E